MRYRNEQDLLASFREAAGIEPTAKTLLMDEGDHTFHVWVDDCHGQIDEYRAIETAPGEVHIFRLPTLNGKQEMVYDWLLNQVHRAQAVNPDRRPGALHVFNLSDHPEVFRDEQIGENLLSHVRPEYQMCVNRLCTELVCEGWLLEMATDYGTPIVTLRPWEWDQAA